MTPLEVCAHVIGLNINHAIASIQEEGCTHRLTYHNGKNLVDNVTKDYSETRINLQVEANKVKRARIG